MFDGSYVVGMQVNHYGELRSGKLHSGDPGTMGLLEQPRVLDLDNENGEHIIKVSGS